MLVKDGKKLKVGFTCSAFDLFHAGHVIMLEEIKNHCDYLIVGLQINPALDRVEKNKPIESIVERYIKVRGSKFVDEIIPYSTEADLEEILSTLPIDIRFLGVEYVNKEFTGKNKCLEREIELYFNRRDHKFSSTDLRRRIAESV